MVVSTLGPDAVRDSNNGGTDRPAERCFYCKENLHDCIQACSLNVTILPTQYTSESHRGTRPFVPVSLHMCLHV